MTILSAITKCFPDSGPPNGIVDIGSREDTDRTDALSFTGIKWRDITWEKWQQGRGAFFGLSPVAFKYFLPSILYLSAQRADQWFAPADSLIQVLDRSPNPEYWDEFIRLRLTELSANAYNVLSEWIVFLSASQIYNLEGALDRAIDTVSLLATSANREA